MIVSSLVIRCGVPNIDTVLNLRLYTTYNCLWNQGPFRFIARTHQFLTLRDGLYLRDS